MSKKEEIKGLEEIKVMVDSFYARVNKDDLLGPVFNDFAKVKWETHLPMMYTFWMSVLFGDMTYKGQPFLKHIPLPVEKKHFDRWVQIFNQNIDELFEGEIAEDAKMRARSIAAIFNHKLELIKSGKF
jgi:hemoglobin